jgi:hypothetical protein
MNRDPLAAYFLNDLLSLILNYLDWSSSVSTVSDYRLEDRTSGLDLRQRKNIFSLSSVSRPSLKPTQPPIQWVPRVFPGIWRGRA